MIYLILTASQLSVQVVVTVLWLIMEASYPGKWGQIPLPWAELPAWAAGKGLGFYP